MATDLEKNCTLKFSDDVAMTAALREATKVDREVVEEIRKEVEGIDQSFQEEKEEIDIKHADVVLKHGEVITAKAEVDTAKAEIEVIQTDVTDKQTDITAKRDEVNATHTLVVDEGKRIKQDIDNFDQTVTDVTQTIDDFNSTTAGKLQEITDEGNTQIQRVNTTGTQQNQLVLDTGADEQRQVQEEGQTQINLINTLSTNEQNEITTKGNEEVARVIAEGETQENRITAAGSNELVDITDKATEQIGRVTAAGDAEVARVDGSGDTEIAQIIAEGDIQEARSKVEADRAKSEADRATTEAGKAATEAVKAKSEADNATAEANRAKVEADRAETEGDTQVARIISEGDTQDTRIITEGDTQAARVINEGDTQTANAAAEADRAADEAAEAASSKVGAQAAQQIAQTAEQGAQAAEQGAINARDDATAIVHNDEGSVVPKPGAYPVAKSDATIDSRWLLLAKTPYSAPLINNFLLMQGTGDPVMMDISPAGDGSIMREVPYLNTIKVTGDEGEFTDEGFKFGRGSILSPTPEVKGIARAVSAVLKEPTAAVANVAYTLNYNGVNSYVEIPEWIIENKDMRISCDVYVPDLSKLGGYAIIVGANNNTHSGLARRDGKNWFIKDQDTGIAPKQGWQHIDVEYTGSVPENPSLVQAIGAAATAYNDFSSITHPFKGQISNLKLIDKQNPSNSRFYPGIVYSYVDPDATDVPMPDSTVLVDEWCVGADYIGQPRGDFLSKSGDLWKIERNEGWIICNPPVGLGETGIPLQYELEIVSGRIDQLLVGGATAPTITKGVVKSANAAEAFSFNGSRVELGTTFRIKVTRVTHGICYNLGTTQPMVPLLGDREEYCGEYTLGAYVRGSSTDRLTGETNVSGRIGSFKSRASEHLPLASIVSAGGVNSVVTRIHDNNGTVDTSTKDTKLFQYPSTFKVIKPTDKDYNDYAPEDWMDWTPNFNGVNSYVEIPEWSAGNYKVELDALITNTNGVLLGSTSRGWWLHNNSKGSFRLSNSFTSEPITGVDQSKPVHIKIEVINGITIFDIAGKVKSAGKLIPICIDTIESEQGDRHILKGQIYNLRLTDLDNPSNSRFYPLIQKGSRTPEGMPKITVAKEMLGAVADVTKLTNVGTQDGAIFTKTGENYFTLARKSDAGSALFNDMQLVAGKSYRLTVSTDITCRMNCFDGNVTDVVSGIYTCARSRPFGLWVENSNRTATVSGFKLEVLDSSGTLVNLGTSAPFVPKLGIGPNGEGEGCVVNYTSGGWRRGVATVVAKLMYNPDLGTLVSPMPPVGATLTAVNQATVRITGISGPTSKEAVYEVISGTDTEIQAGFQYPSVFKITPP